MKKKLKKINLVDLGYGKKFKKGLVLTGTAKYKDGSIYTASLKNKKKQIPHGYGKYIYSDGENKYYIGNLKNGKKDGKGFFRCNEYSYSGQWKNDMMHGKGIIIYASKETFSGIFNKDKYVTGKFMTEEGDLYEGGFKNFQYHGKGKYVAKDKSFEFQGSFKNGKINGKGKLIKKESIYIGNFKDSKRHGFGVNTDRKRKFFYKGQWKEDKMSGKGIMDYGDGGIYKGNWKNGERNGKGILTENKGRLAGTSFSGNWQDGRMEGIFIVKNKKGKKIKELYENDIFIKYIK